MIDNFNQCFRGLKFYWNIVLICIRIVWEVSVVSSVGLWRRVRVKLTLLLPEMDCLESVGVWVQTTLTTEWTSTLMMAFGPICSQTNKQIVENSMPEDDPNSNSDFNTNHSKQFRWGPNHEGAKQLARLYTNGLYTFHWIPYNSYFNVVMV